MQPLLRGEGSAKRRLAHSTYPDDGQRRLGQAEPLVDADLPVGEIEAQEEQDIAIMAEEVANEEAQGKAQAQP